MINMIAPIGIPTILIHAYTSGKEHLKGLTETEFILSIFHQNRIEAIQAFREFMKQENEDTCLDEEIKRKKTDGEVKTEIEALMDGEPIGKLQCSCLSSLAGT